MYSRQIAASPLADFLPEHEVDSSTKYQPCLLNPVSFPNLLMPKKWVIQPVSGSQKSGPFYGSMRTRFTGQMILKLLYRQGAEL